MKPVIFADLDDTLFSSMKAFSGVEPGSLRQVTVSPTGKHSYFCAQRAAIFEWLSQSGILIPVTARSYRAFAQVQLEFAHGAVLNNGALILSPEGGFDRVWMGQVEQILRREAAGFAEALGATYHVAHDVRRIEHRDPVLELMNGLTFKSDLRDPHLIRARLDVVETALRDAGVVPHFQVHRNSDYLFLVPKGISKALAVDYLLRTRPDLSGLPTLGFGDSISDLEFMSRCMIMMLPKGAQNTAQLLGEH